MEEGEGTGRCNRLINSSFYFETLITKHYRTSNITANKKNVVRYLANFI